MTVLLLLQLTLNKTNAKVNNSQPFFFSRTESEIRCEGEEVEGVS